MGRQTEIYLDGQFFQVHNVDDEAFVSAIATLTETDGAINAPAPVTKSTPKQRSNVSGRGRFHDVCPLHGPSTNGDPCEKFSHLPGKGKGPHKPHPFLFARAVIIGFIKPAVIFAILFLAYKLISGHVGNLIPTVDFGVTPTPVVTGNAGPNRAGNDDRIKPDCFQPGNPCHLIYPTQVVPK